MAEPTSSLTWDDILIRVAEKLGLAYYGAAGDEAAQAPTDTHDLDLLTRYLRDGFRMLIADAPPEGWRWQRQLAEVVLWQDVAEDDDVTVDGGLYSGGVTPITASEATFYPSMENKTIIIDGVGSFVIASYTSSTVVSVTGDASTASSDVFSIASDESWTLPSSFSGEHIGQPTYAAGSDTGVPLQWVSELEIRRLRENDSGTTGNPIQVAVRLSSTNRRWELVAYPLPGGDYTIEFPYLIRYDQISTLSAYHPAGGAFDDVVLAACLARAEMSGEDQAAGAANDYTNRALPRAYMVNGRIAPKRLGYCGNPGAVTVTPRNFRYWQQRPTVSYSE